MTDLVCSYCGLPPDQPPFGRWADFTIENGEAYHEGCPERALLVAGVEHEERRMRAIIGLAVDWGRAHSRDYDDTPIPYGEILTQAESKARS